MRVVENPSWTVGFIGFNQQFCGGKAKSTFQTCMDANGADAPKWYQAGQVQRVANYCADDVALERDLCDFIDRYGYVLLPSKTNSALYQRLTLPPWQGGK